MSASREAFEAARARAKAEKAMARQSFAELKAAASPGAIASRAGRKAKRGVTSAASSAAETVRTHPVATASIVAGTGLVLAAKPIGEFLADEFAYEPHTNRENDR